MAIKIIEDQIPDIYLTASEHAKLLKEYNNAFMFYSGTPPTFEHWVAARINPAKQLLTEVTA
jgi:hypothetical protein